MMFHCKSRPHAKFIAGIALIVTAVFAVPGLAYDPGLQRWAGKCAQSQGMAPGCGRIPVERGSSDAQPSAAEQQQIEEQQRALDRLQKAREEEEARARQAADADEAGLEAEHAGDWAGAAEKFLEALALAPDNAAIRAHLDRANIALADMASATGIAALRQRIQDQMAAASISAMRMAAEDAIRVQTLMALYESFIDQGSRDIATNPRNPISPDTPRPDAPERDWADIESFAAPGTANPEILKIQRIDEDGIGPVNNDYYAITIDSAGETAADVARNLRQNLSTLVYSGTHYAVEDYDAANGVKWASSHPQGALVTFVLANFGALAQWLPASFSYRGDVVVSYVSDTEWVFSTVETKKSGWHPVCGNRAFGVRANADGSLTIWTKAADRAVDHKAFWLKHQFAAGREDTFVQGDSVWRGLMTNLATHYGDRHPRNPIRISVRRPR